MIEGQWRRRKIDLQDRHDLHVHSLYEVEKSEKTLLALKSARENLLYDLTSCENQMVGCLTHSKSSEIEIQEQQHRI